jgi:hypothetical protein
VYSDARPIFIEARRVTTPRAMSILSAEPSIRFSRTGLFAHRGEMQIDFSRSDHIREPGIAVSRNTRRRLTTA